MIDNFFSFFHKIIKSEKCFLPFSSFSGETYTLKHFLHIFLYIFSCKKWVIGPQKISCIFARNNTRKIMIIQLQKSRDLYKSAECNGRNGQLFYCYSKLCILISETLLIIYPKTRTISSDIWRSCGFFLYKYLWYEYIIIFLSNKIER